MAKFNEREGNSCHIHLSVRVERRRPGRWPGDGEYGFSPLHGALDRRHPRDAARVHAAVRADDQLVQALPEGHASRPTGVAWGLDNRTCALRVIGRGHSLRVENRVPGGDVNPYLAISAIIAGGLYGVENELPLPEPLAGNAYSPASTICRRPCARRRGCSSESSIARAAFGDDMVEHYLNQARIEVEAYDAAVTDWERIRGFERL